MAPPNKRMSLSAWYQNRGPAIRKVMFTMSITVFCINESLVSMINPTHPGEIVRHECLEPLRLTVTRAAKGLGISRQTLSELVNEKAGVSVEMAIRLSKGFGSTLETWLGLQTAYDPAKARSKKIEGPGAGGLPDPVVQLAPIICRLIGHQFEFMSAIFELSM